MENEWQTIETAPFDIRILLFDSESKFKGVFTGYKVMANKGMEDEYPLVMDNDRYDFIDATHWMPCPLPPN